MMDHFILAAQLGIFVAKDIEAVGAGGNDLLYTIVVEQLDILIRHHLEKKFIPGPANGVARTHLFLAEYGVTDADLIEDGGEGTRDLLGALIEAAGAADPEQDIGVFALCGKLSYSWNLHERINFCKFNR
jgi:hypothetical protein